MPAASRAGVAPHPHTPIVPPTTADCLLVVGVVALTLGLAAVSASLAPTAPEPGDHAPDRPRSVMAAAGPPGLPPRFSGVERAPRSPDIADVADTPIPAPPANAVFGRPSISPLYPQNGVTLWDHIRVSPSRDRRAFLLGTTIQIHAPEIAATPGPRYGLPHPQGVD